LIALLAGNGARICIRAGFPRWDAVLMAIRALDLLHIQATVGHLGMAGLAGCAGILIVPCMAGDATQSFMHTDGGAIVS
jgi:hypothetical protein